MRRSDEESAAIARVLATTSDWALDHVRQVERVASALFSALALFHGFGPEEETLLCAAALLHDVGYPVDPDRHHKISARIIRAHLGLPFDPRQVELIALLARYHRKALPKLSHRRYRELAERDRRVVGWLGGILRVADGLDRAHDAGVESVAIALTDSRLEILVGPAEAAVVRPPARLARVAAEEFVASNGDARGDGEPRVDVQGAMRKRDLLERAMGRSILVRVV